MVCVHVHVHAVIHVLNVHVCTSYICSFVGVHVYVCTVHVCTSYICIFACVHVHAFM